MVFKVFKFANNEGSEAASALPYFWSNSGNNLILWVFLYWYFAHLLFDYSVNILLKKFNIKEYRRIRIVHALWYFLFNITIAVVYVVDSEKMPDFELNNLLPSHVTIVFAMIFTFYLHSAFWEVTICGLYAVGLEYLLLSLSLVLLCQTEYYEDSLLLLFSTSVIKGFLEFARIVAALTRTKDKKTYSGGLQMLFAFQLANFIAAHVIWIVRYIIWPFTDVIITKDTYYPTYVILLSWFFVSIRNSVVFKYIVHRFYHNHEESVNNGPCRGNYMDCALFPQRTDFWYIMSFLRTEMIRRENKRMAMRKPKNSRGALVQTLKCMVALKRKIKSKHLTSEETPIVMEKSENSDEGINTDSQQNDSTMLEHTATVTKKRTKNEVQVLDMIDNSESSYVSS